MGPAIRPAHPPDDLVHELAGLDSHQALHKGHHGQGPLVPQHLLVPDQTHHQFVTSGQGLAQGVAARVPSTQTMSGVGYHPRDSHCAVPTEITTRCPPFTTAPCKENVWAISVPRCQAHVRAATMRRGLPPKGLSLEVALDSLHPAHPSQLCTSKENSCPWRVGVKRTAGLAVRTMRR
jgi:hypothetical protein